MSVALNERGLNDLFDGDGEEPGTAVEPVIEASGAAGAEVTELRRRTFADGPGTAVLTKEQEYLKRDEALRLRMGGYTYRQIAEVMEISPAAVSNLITRALEAAPNEKAQQQRAIENARLDRLQAAVWQDALKGDVKAIDAVLRISRRRAEMNGLDAPKKIDIRASVRHDINRAVTELQEVLLGEVIEVDDEGNIVDAVEVEGVTDPREAPDGL